MFYCIFINKFFKNLPGGSVSSTLTPPQPPPRAPAPSLCIYVLSSFGSSVSIILSDKNLRKVDFVDLFNPILGRENENAMSADTDEPNNEIWKD